jgi:integrase
MATINYLYRSTREKASLILRILFRHNETDFVFGAKTKIEVSKNYWNKDHKKTRLKDTDLINLQTEINEKTAILGAHVLTKFNKTKIEHINKEWLQTQINEYYNPPQQATALPIEVVKYIKYFIEAKRNDISVNSIKKYNVLKQLLIRYELSIKKPLLFIDVDTNFKKSFEDYCLKNLYAPNTIARAIRSVKTICKHAKYNGVETSYQLDNIRVKYNKVENVYLTFDEIEKLENIKKKEFTESLKNSRDWLIISCYTGQRISDFMRFTDEQIRIENGQSLIEFTQKKTGKIMTIPLHPKVLEILKKRNGKFPYPISDQKYNDQIKTVGRLAGLTEKVKGSKKIETAPKSKIFRKKSGLFEKCELITSHIGRRSFATNFYGDIPTTYLIYATGHSTEAMFLNYIGKSNKDLSMELGKYFKY